MTASDPAPRDTAAPRLGWAGTGRMGYAMVSRLLAAGCDVGVWNRTRSKAEPLAALGATVVDTLGELADRDVVFVMVATSADFAQVTLGEGGLLRREGAAPGVLVNCSTVSAEVSEQVRAEASAVGTLMLAAPVSGNGKVVDAGRLTLVASGPEEAYERVRPLLDLLGDGATYAGAGEAALLVKLCHNIFLGVVTQSLAEITVLAEKGGVSRSAFLTFLNDSVLGSTFTRYKTPAFVNLDFTPTFTPVLLRKDLELGLAAARELQVPMPLAALTAQLVGAVMGRGHLDEDFAVLLVEQARSADLALKSEGVEVSDGLGPRDAS